jgi:hypothetical protein
MFITYGLFLLSAELMRRTEWTSSLKFPSFFPADKSYQWMWKGVKIHHCIVKTKPFALTAAISVESNQQPPIVMLSGHRYKGKGLVSCIPYPSQFSGIFVTTYAGTDRSSYCHYYRLSIIFQFISIQFLKVTPVMLNNCFSIQNSIRSNESC